MGKIDKVETQRRISEVMDWIISGLAVCAMVKKAVEKWAVSERQAKRYIATGRLRWTENEDENIEQRRSLKIISLQKLKSSLKKKYEGTPSGIFALIAIEKELIKLEKLEAPKRVELTGKDGKPLNITNPGEIDYEKLSDDVLNEIVNARKNKNEQDPEDTDS